MNSLVSHWKTTTAGVLCVLLAGLDQFAGIHVAGFHMDFSTALITLVSGLGLIAAKDASGS